MFSYTMTLVGGREIKGGCPNFDVTLRLHQAVYGSSWFSIHGDIKRIVSINPSQIVSFEVASDDPSAIEQLNTALAKLN